MAGRGRRPMTPRSLFGPNNGQEAASHPYRRNLSVSSNSSSSFSDGISPSDLPTAPASPSSGESTTGSVSSAMECKKCLRQGAPLFCFSCGFWMANGRVAQHCPQHPKVIFYTDFTICPKCKKEQLRELD